MTSNPVLLSSTYLGPIQFYSKFFLGSTIFIEQYDNFIKQTYRNRCVILGANGPISLVIPVEKGRNAKTQVKDVKIYNQELWKRNHWRSIFSAYNSSPFFEYYEDGLHKIYDRDWVYLVDFNMAIQSWLMEELELNNSIFLTENYFPQQKSNNDFRELISPKNKQKDSHFQNEPYIQVFESKFGFVPNLSVIDLLFNQGPNSNSILEASLI